MRSRPRRWRGAALPTRHGSSPITRRSARPSCWPSRATARRRHSMAGSPTCTTRRCATGCTALPARPSCCGANGTASSRRPTASGSPPRCRRPASRRSPTPVTTRRSNSPRRSPSRSSISLRKTNSRDSHASGSPEPPPRRLPPGCRFRGATGQETDMMQVWHFSEMAYHPAWPQLTDTYRVLVPSRLYDPKLGADLYHRYLDEWALCDELGINIMTNEHHATATCLDSVCTIPMAILARETKRVRLLALGVPIANRNDPIRVAEEYAMLDVISRGRIEMGFVKGVPFEISPANSNPADLMERFWEAHDLILKAMTSHDGPFNWEGTHFHYRSVNVWPRPWQEPHPPVWMPVGSPGSAREAAARGITIGVLNTGWVLTPPIFEA